jgi:DNA modification methylase
MRRSLSHVGGTVEMAGDREVARLLAHALDVTPAPSVSPSPSSVPDDPDRVHVHGFHAYPARMHPTTAERLIRRFSNPGDTVLDPFCGSGTVLVEAMLAARRAVGVDLSPLAVSLARLKTTPRDAREREAIVAAAQSVAALADTRRENRAGASQRYPPEDVAAFDPHVLLELDSLRVGIRSQKGPAVREALELVLSAILVKVSRRRSDTSAAEAPRRIAAGFTARLFARKAAELARRVAQFAALLPTETAAPIVLVDDASRLRTVAASTVDAVITSPPYVATYDYSEQHAMRMRWLGLDKRALELGEVGARRRYARLQPGAAHAAWRRELAAVLSALSRVCRKGASVAIVAGDSAVGGEALRADEAIAAVAPGTGFAVIGRASQRRPHFHGPTARAFRNAPRAEHAIALEKR